MKVVQIQNEAEFRGLKSAWGALLSESHADVIFLTWEWVTAWWSAYGKPGELWILAALDDHDVLRGIAPLRRETVRRYGRTASALTFVGDGSNDSDYLDLIIAPGYEEQVMASFRAHWMKELNRGTVLVLNEIPETSRCLSLLTNVAKSQGAIWTESDVPCGTVHLPESWNEYLAKLRPRFRTKIRSVLRDLEGRPEVQFGFCETREHVRGMLPILFDLHTKRWTDAGKPGVFGWEQKREFYFALSELLLERGWLRFSWLKWNDTVLACQYGFGYQGKYFLLQEGYEPASEHWNLGIGLRAWSIRKFVEEGLREYDFLGGRVLRHRSDWGAELKHSKRIQLAEATYKNLLFCRGSEWEERARRSLKGLVPEKILAARKDRLENRSAVAAESAAARSSRNGLLQRAAAHCYFHFRLPALARPVREQYQLTVSPKGKLRKFSWSRRTEPSVRILYYHRVNDEKDPFFPAISTALFEREMRYVAEHYPVVSLTGALDHLKRDTGGTVIAITFDDGYQDNYVNAFPVLQRYNLPATIFLTTGALDSREPLWFEQLAQVLKKTDRESIDLEIDLPRRFWMRTQSERLDSNGRIYGLLRGLPDSERQRWLSKILRQLGDSSTYERKDQMLTWDQVRLMNVHGIDFGGHSVNHPFISRLTRERVIWEVSECKRRIEDELQLPADHFAYPSGREEDFGKWNEQAIRNAGYRSAVTTIWGMNFRSTGPMELRRGGPWEETPAQFACKLDWYQLVNG
jgi:peptidoglycan/xylan/chitin deacetylase (PgdA/CDA1 family)/CelD/BcsL family acetyltransferase involved in cellulose biosynthesis